MVLSNDRCYRIEADQGMHAVINKLNSLAMGGEYVFRGYSTQNELFPSIIRTQDYSKYEYELLQNFEKYGSNYFHTSNTVEFMSVAQHYGLPTRLLDFTHNPFIALSFALYKPKLSLENYSDNEDCNYYYIRYASLHDNICAQAICCDSIFNGYASFVTDSIARKTDLCIRLAESLIGVHFVEINDYFLEFPCMNSQLVNETKEKVGKRTILFIDPNYSNQRIILQQGLFMFPYTLNKTEHIDILNKNSGIIMIHKDLRNDLNRYLNNIGFNAFRLMPDLSSICDAIKNKCLGESNDNWELRI